MINMIFFLLEKNYLHASKIQNDDTHYFTFFFFFLLRNDYFTNLDCIKSCFLKQKEKKEEEEDCITS